MYRCYEHQQERVAYNIPTLSIQIPSRRQEILLHMKISTYIIIAVALSLLLCGTEAEITQILSRPHDSPHPCPCGWDGLKIDYPGTGQIGDGHYVTVEYDSTGSFLTSFKSDMYISLIIIKAGTVDLIYEVCPAMRSASGLELSAFDGKTISHVAFCANKAFHVGFADMHVIYRDTYDWTLTCSYDPIGPIMPGGSVHYIYHVNASSSELPVSYTVEISGTVSVTNPALIPLYATVIFTAKIPCLSQSGVTVTFGPFTFEAGETKTFPIDINVDTSQACVGSDKTVTQDMFKVSVLVSPDSDALCVPTTDPDMCNWTTYYDYFMTFHGPEEDPPCSTVTQPVCNSITSPIDPISVSSFVGPCVIVTSRQVDCTDESISLGNEIIISGTYVLTPPSANHDYGYEGDSGPFTVPTTICTVAAIRQVAELCDPEQPPIIPPIEFDLSTLLAIANCSAYYDITFSNPETGCTYTLGYWKTHGITVKMCPVHNQNCTRVNVIEQILQPNPDDSSVRIFLAGTLQFDFHTPYGVVPFEWYESGHYKPGYTIAVNKPYGIRQLLDGSWEGYASCRNGWTYIQLLKQFVAAAFNKYSILSNFPSVIIPDSILKDMRDANTIFSLYNCDNWANAMKTIWPSSTYTYDARAKAIHSDLDKWNNGLWPGAQPHCG